MEKFFSLPEEKQNAIINAALTTFGTNGYKKTSVSDIAGAAGISKAMVFHYFGTKKELYFYMVKLCGKIIMDEVNEKFDNTITDFFERIKLTSEIELSVMKRYSAIPAFITSAYFENDEEVRADLQALFADGDGFRNKIAFDGTDTSKFKEGVDINLVVKMLLWLAEGYTSHLSKNTDINFDEMLTEFNECMDLLKKNLYKKEYL